MPSTFRAEIIGSMLRPPYLKEARAAHDAGRLSHAEFKRIEDRAVDQAIAKQEATGVDVVSDGEMRRYIFSSLLVEAVEGIEPVGATKMEWHEVDGQTVEWNFPFVVTGKVRKRRSLVTEEYAYARARARVPLKVSVPSPLMLFPMWWPERSGEVYDDPFEMFADAAAIVRSEVEELVGMGCQYIQVDAPDFTNLVDPTFREWLGGRGIDPGRFLHEGAELINQVVDGLSGVHLGVHLCRGNNAGKWLTQGGYESIADAVFKRAPAFDSFLLEYDDERSGSFESLREAPPDKQIVLGLVSTKRPELESADELKRRIDDAAACFPLEQLALSTQCGFASIFPGNPITGEIEEDKLRLVANVAHDVWG